MSPPGRKTTSIRFSKPRATTSTLEPSGLQRISAALDPGDLLPVAAGEAVAVRLAGGHVEQPVWAEHEPVKAAVVRMAEAREDHPAPVGLAVVVEVLEHGEVRRIGDVELSSVPGEPHGGREVLGEDGRGLEDPVAVLVLEPADPAAAGLLLELGVEVAARRFGDVEAAAVVERREHGKGRFATF